MYLNTVLEGCEQMEQGWRRAGVFGRGIWWLGVYKPQDVYKSLHRSSLECIIGNNISRAGTAEVMDCECGQGCWQPRKGVEKKQRLSNPGMLTSLIKPTRYRVPNASSGSRAQ